MDRVDITHTFAYKIAIFQLNCCHFETTDTSSIATFGLETGWFTLFIEIATFVDRRLWDVAMPERTEKEKREETDNNMRSFQFY